MTVSGSNSWTAITWPRPLSARRSHVMGNLIAFRLNSTGAYGKPNSRLLIRANIVTFALLTALVSKWQQSGNNTNDMLKTLRKQAKSSTPSSGTIDFPRLTWHLTFAAELIRSSRVGGGAGPPERKPFSTDSERLASFLKHRRL